MVIFSHGVAAEARKVASFGSKEESFLEKLEVSYSHPSNSEAHPMPKYIKIQKCPYYKDYSKCPEIQG